MKGLCLTAVHVFSVYILSYLFILVCHLRSVIRLIIIYIHCMVAFIVSCYVRCAAWCFTAKIRSMTYLELDECSTNRSIYLQFIFADDERSIKKKRKRHLSEEKYRRR